jgi:hypothetical protein
LTRSRHDWLSSGMIWVRWIIDRPAWGPIILVRTIRISPSWVPSDNATKLRTAPIAGQPLAAWVSSEFDRTNPTATGENAPNEPNGHPIKTRRFRDQVRPPKRNMTFRETNRGWKECAERTQRSPRKCVERTQRSPRKCAERTQRSRFKGAERTQGPRLESGENDSIKLRFSCARLF